jgi:hypothetical protein
LKGGESSDTVTFESTLDSINEGSPSFESVNFKNSLKESSITLFYEFQNFMRKTKVAKGMMSPNPDGDSPKWKTYPANINEVFDASGLLTTFGSRSKFMYDKKNYYLVETSKYNSKENTLESYIALCDKAMVPLALLPF